MDQIRIGILSDTHNLLRPEITAALRGADRILHAGDIAKPEILEELRKIAPVTAVRGNADMEWAEELPLLETFEEGGIRFLMAHKKKDIPAGVPADVVVFGHSHRYEERREGGTLFLNPGSCGPRRFSQPVTMMILEIAGGEIRTARVDIPQAGKAPKVPPDRDLGKLVAEVVREVDRGRPPAEIAGKCGITEKLADEICRLYLTHPGIDADGIITKMELYRL